MQLGLSKLLKQVLSFTMLAALCFSRKLNKVSLESLALDHMWNRKHPGNS